MSDVEELPDKRKKHGYNDGFINPEFHVNARHINSRFDTCFTEEQVYDMCERLKAIAVKYSCKSSNSYEDYFQEAWVSIFSAKSIESRGQLEARGRYGMQTINRKEHLQNKLKEDYMQVVPYLDKSAGKSFEQLEELSEMLLEGKELEIFRAWLEAYSLAELKRKFNLSDFKVKKAVNDSARKISEYLGQELDICSIWPKLNKTLPEGVTLQHGKYVARKGQKYIGVFKTIEQAKDAREQLLKVVPENCDMEHWRAEAAKIKDLILKNPKYKKLVGG